MTTTTKYLSVRPVGHFLRHLGEMILAMMAGMMAGAAVLALIFSTVLAATIRGTERVNSFETDSDRQLRYVGLGARGNGQRLSVADRGPGVKGPRGG